MDPHPGHGGPVHVHRLDDEGQGCPGLAGSIGKEGQAGLEGPVEQDRMNDEGLIDRD